MIAVSRPRYLPNGEKEQLKRNLWKGAAWVTSLFMYKTVTPQWTAVIFNASTTKERGQKTRSLNSSLEKFMGLGHSALAAWRRGVSTAPSCFRCVRVSVRPHGDCRNDSCTAVLIPFVSGFPLSPQTAPLLEPEQRTQADSQTSCVVVKQVRSM